MRGQCRWLDSAQSSSHVARILECSDWSYATRKRHKNTEKTPNSGQWRSVTGRNGYSLFAVQRPNGPLTSAYTFAPRSVRPPPPPRVLTRQCEDCWRCTNTRVTFNDFASPGEGVADPNPRWLGGRPQLEVLGTIVMSNAVPMMNRLTIVQVPPKQILRHENVFEDVRTTRGPRMVRSADHEVSRLCLVRPPFQLPFASAATLRQSLQVADFSCLERPQAQTLFDRHAGTAEVAARGPKNMLTLLASTAPHGKTPTIGCDRGASSYKCRQSGVASTTSTITVIASAIRVEALRATGSSR